MPDLSIPTTAGGAMPAYFAAPQTARLAPGVVVLHTVGGLTDDIRSQADWLANEGFFALAPRLYHRGGFFRCVRQMMRDLIDRRGPLFDDIESARHWLTEQPGSNGRTGVIGFCMGGGIAMLLCSGHGFAASSINYGGKLPPDVETLLAASCPIVASYGAKDRWNQGVADELDRILDRLLIPHDVKEYPDAGHSFLNDEKGFLFHVLRYVDIAYNEAAALDARRRIAAFFRTHLAT